MKIANSLILLAAIAAAQNSVTTPVDNEQVKVLNVTVPPHQKGKMHDHKINRVMIYLQAGKQELVFQDGKKQPLTWKAGDVKWSAAAGMHTAEITSDKPVTIIEVELKKGAPAKVKPAGDLDPVKLDPKHYKVEFENAQVRVLRVKIGGKETVPMHVHSRDRVVAYITDMDFRVTGGDGKAVHATHKAGDVTFSGEAKHKEENLSDKPLELVVVELKG